MHHLTKRFMGCILLKQKAQKTLWKGLLGSVEISKTTPPKHLKEGNGKMSEIFCLQRFSSRKPQHEAWFDRAAVNAVSQVITCISESILHSPAVSSPSWPLYDNNHFTKKQPHLLAQVNHWVRRDSLPAPTQPSTYFFLSYLPLKLAALHKTSRRHPRWLLLLNKLPPSLSLLVCPSALQPFPHCGSEVSFSTTREKKPKANGSFVMQPPPVLPSDHLSPANPENPFCWGFFLLFFAKSTAGDSGHSLRGNAITQLSWPFFVCLFSAALLLLSSKCDKQCRYRTSVLFSSRLNTVRKAPVITQNCLNYSAGTITEISRVLHCSGFVLLHAIAQPLALVKKII